MLSRIFLKTASSLRLPLYLGASKIKTYYFPYKLLALLHKNFASINTITKNADINTMVLASETPVVLDFYATYPLKIITK